MQHCHFADLRIEKKTKKIKKRDIATYPPISIYIGVDTRRCQRRITT